MKLLNQAIVPRTNYVIGSHVFKQLPGLGKAQRGTMSRDNTKAKYSVPLSILLVNAVRVVSAIPPTITEVRSHSTHVYLVFNTP
jgi:hypothetical protein